MYMNTKGDREHEPNNSRQVHAGGATASMLSMPIQSADDDP
jgi:hypothetical protein